MINDPNQRTEKRNIEFERKLYWKRVLKDVKRISYIVKDYSREALCNNNMKCIVQTFPKGIREQVHQITKDKMLSDYIFHIVILSIVLYKLSENSEVLLWSPDYINESRYILCRISLEDSQTFREALAMVWKLVKENLGIQGLYYDEFNSMIDIGTEGGLIPNSDIMIKSTLLGRNDAYIPSCCMCFEFGLDENNTDIRIYYNELLFKDNTVKTVMHNYMNALNNILRNTNQNINDITLISEEDCEMMLRDWIKTDLTYPINFTITQLFQKQVKMTPDDIAATMISDFITYQELEDASNRIASFLCCDKRIENNYFVAIMMERNINFLVSMLGTMKSGKAYLPIQPDYPWERIKYMLIDSGVNIVIVSKTVLEKYYEELEQCDNLEVILCMNEENSILLNHCDVVYPSQISFPQFDLPKISPEDIAYLIYTSGTTGKPKGVMIRHKSLVNHIYAEFDDLNINLPFIFLQSAPSSSDISVWQFLAPLCIGGTTAIIGRDDILDMRKLYKFILEHKITMIEFVPQLLREFVSFIAYLDNKAELENTLRYVIVTGERVPASLVNSTISNIRGVKVINAYGPTEAADDVIQEVYTDKVEDNLLRLSIGHPLKNIDVYILDENRNMVPIGVKGEIFISGIALSTGYWGDEGKTSEFFIANPFHQGEYMYRTGDFGCWRLDGSIDYFGRRDYQVKINGYRIELEEIDSILMECVYVKQSVSVLKKDLIIGRDSIVTYMKVESDEFRENIMKFIKKNIPHHMIPSKIIFLDHIPVNQAGKIDRKYLMDLNDAEPKIKKGVNSLKQELSDVQSKMVNSLLQIWRDVFKNNDIHEFDDFFDLGGDSINSIQLAARAEQKGILITPKDIFDHLTIIEIVLHLDYGQNEEPSYGNEQILVGEVPLSPIQSWFFHQEYEEPEYFNQAILLEISSHISYEMIEEVLIQIINNHDMLRAYYVMKNDNIIQKCIEMVDTVPLVLENIGMLDKDARKERILKVSQQYQKDFQLNQPLLERFILFQCGNQENNQLLIIIHHLLVDSVSWQIIAEDLKLAFSQAVHSETIQLSKRTTSYKAWQEAVIAYMTPERISVMKKKWDDMLLEAKRETKQIPICERGLLNSIDFEINKEMTQKVIYMLQIYNINMQDILLSLLIQVVHDLWNTNTVMIDMESMGRNYPDILCNISNTVGWFTAIYPILINKQENEDVNICATRIHKRISEIDPIVFGILMYGMEDLVDNQDFEYPESGIRLNYMGQIDLMVPTNPYFSISSYAIFSSYSKKNTSKYLLDINIGMINDKLYFNILYNVKGIDRPAASKIKERFLYHLNKLYTKNVSAFSIYGFGLGISEDDISQYFPDRKNIENIYPVTPMQEAILTHNVMYCKQIYSKQVIKSDISGEINIKYFVQAWKDVIEIHPILRSSFIWRKVPIMLQVLYKKLPLDFQYIDLSNRDKVQKQIEIERIQQREKEFCFNISKCPLIRFLLLKMEKGKYQFVVNYSTSLFDNWSWKNIVETFMQRYESYLCGDHSRELVKYPIDDYISYVYHSGDKKCADFWKKELQGVHVSSIGKGIKDMNALFIPKVEIGKIEEAESSEIIDFCRERNLTINTILQSSWAVAFCHMQKTEDVAYAVLSSGRPLSIKNIDKLVGPLSNLIPMRCVLEEDETIFLWLNKIQNKQIEAVSYDCISLKQIADYLQMKPDDIQRIIYERSFIFMDSYESNSDNLTHAMINIQNSEIDLFHKVPFRGYGSFNQGINIIIKYDERLISKKYVCEFLDYMIQVIKFIVAHSLSPSKQLLHLTDR